MPKPSFTPSPLYRFLSRIILLGCGLIINLAAYAELPAAVQDALSRADLSAENISLIIMPVMPETPGQPSNQGQPTQSHLPAVVTPEGQELGDSPQSSDTDKPSDPAQSSDIVKPSSIDKPSDNNGVAAAENMVTQVDVDYTITGDQLAINQQQPSSQSGASTSTAIAPPKPEPLISGIFHNPELPRTPASTMKLIPTFIALDTLGSDFVWQTRVYYSGLRVGAQLYGDLIIQGSGDPKLTEDQLRQLLYQVTKAGIRQIHGNIIIDTSVFQNVTKDPAAFDNDPLRPYNASPDGFLVNYSSMEIHSYPDEHGLAQLTYRPRLADYQLPDTVSVRPDQSSCQSIRYSLDPYWGSEGLSFNRALPNGCAEHTFYVAFPDAKVFASRVVAQLWSDLGNTVSGAVISQEQPAQRASMAALPIVSYPSFPLASLIHDINHHSNNVMTEQVTLSLPIYAKSAKARLQNESIHTPPLLKASYTPSRQISNNIANTKSRLANYKRHSSLYYDQASSDYPTALQTMNQWWQQHLTTPPPNMTNGSGLCRSCTVSANNLAELLQYAYHHPEFSSYVDSLGVAGVSGTIADHGLRLPSSQAIGRAWIKTGTLSNVTAMAGYVKGLSGQDYVVVGIINNEQKINTYAARLALDQMLDWTAQH